MPVRVLDRPVPYATERFVDLPPVSAVVRHVLTYLVEVTIIPAVLFYTVFVHGGLKPALLAALGWSSTALVRRVATRQRIPATLVLSLLLMIARTTVAWLSGSVFLYFLQPVLTTTITAAILLGSVWIGRPFIAKAVKDYVPSLPEEWAGDPHVMRFFSRCSLLWGGMYLFNAATTIWALTVASLGPFMLISKGGGTLAMASVVVMSIVWFRRTLRREGIQLRFGAAPPARLETDLLEEAVLIAA